MKREIRFTKDGSPTLYLPEWDEYFHSHNGALQESLHIFIALGLDFILEGRKQISILEFGYGTGLNALLSWDYCKDKKCSLKYTGIELFPVKAEENKSLKYSELTNDISEAINLKMFDSDWGKIVKIEDGFELEKLQMDMLEFVARENSYDLIYMDAFNPDIQPDLWSIEQFSTMYQSLRSGGVLTTYSVKGWVKRNMKAAGFLIEKHPGPPGKREVLRAIKP